MIKHGSANDISANIILHTIFLHMPLLSAKISDVGLHTQEVTGSSPAVSTTKIP